MSLAELASEDANAAMRETIRNFLCHISKHVDADGMIILVSEVTSKTHSGKVTIRVEICWMLGVICEERESTSSILYFFILLG